ncbi:MAG: hypothetical protein JWM59_3420 [Verrucomicrobiales bacterium]|nr:hypothetical protein [Verrucomicrobiales bacterium]
MNDASLSRLRALAAIWDDLARTHSHAFFNTEFFQDLERLNRFQEEFPGKSPDLLVGILEHKVLCNLSQLHSGKEIVQARARLAQPDTEKACTA